VACEELHQSIILLFKGWFFKPITAFIYPIPQFWWGDFIRARRLERVNIYFKAVAARTRAGPILGISTASRRRLSQERFITWWKIESIAQTLLVKATTEVWKVRTLAL
jgi:hypothetical protein